MKEAPEIIYYLVIPIIGLIAWLIRLDSKSNQNTIEIKEIHEQLKEHLDHDDETHQGLMDTLIDIKEDVSEIKGYLKH